MWENLILQCRFFQRINTNQPSISSHHVDVPLAQELTGFLASTKKKKKVVWKTMPHVWHRFSNPADLAYNSLWIVCHYESDNGMRCNPWEHAKCLGLIMPYNWHFIGGRYWDYHNPEFIIYPVKCNRSLKGILQSVDNLQKADNAVAGYNKQQVPGLYF